MTETPQKQPPPPGGTPAAPINARQGVTNQFAEQANQASPGLLRELWDLLMENKKWWLAPIILVLLGVAVLAIYAATSVAAPFIYTLF